MFNYRFGAVLLAVTWVGCAAEVSVVRRDATGGELLLRGPHAPAAIEARTLFAPHCGGRYRCCALR